MQRIARRIGHCECLTEESELGTLLFGSSDKPWTDTADFFCSIVAGIVQAGNDEVYVGKYSIERCPEAILTNNI